MEPLARKIAALELADVQLGEIVWDSFSDGWPNICIKKFDNIRQCNVAFLAAFQKPADVMPQLSAIYALPRCGANNVQIILPYYPTGTMDRADDQGQVVTAKSLATMFDALPFDGLRKEIVIYDIHSLQQNHFFNKVQIRVKTGLKYLAKRLEGMDAVVAFPDFGAHKRFGGLLARDYGYKQESFVVCHKVRDGDKRTVNVVQGDAKGRNVVIVDDIILSGGTILECKNALLAAGAASVSAYATHGSFPDEAWKKFVDAGFNKVWITDSCPWTVAAVADNPTFEILSLDASIARVIAS
jgi:ribose-phosphate pyrophosphokinase